MILTSLRSLDEKSKELLSEGRKLIGQTEYSPSSILSFNEIFKKYRQVEMQKEFCNYCLMFNEVIDE